MFDLAGRRALAMGSGQGIGLDLAAALPGAGAAVAPNGRDAAKLDRAAATLRANGAMVECAPFDATDPGAVASGIAAVEAGGPPDILVNNAGIQRRAPLQDFPEATWRELMATNLDSVFFVAHAGAGADGRFHQPPQRFPDGDHGQEGAGNRHPRQTAPFALTVIAYSEVVAQI